MRSIAGVAADLAAGRVSSRELLEQALARIADPSGEGSRVFTRVHAASARAAADAADASRKAGVRLSPLAGVPVSVKDLFDLAGETTTAGSRVLRQHPAAAADALRRLAPPRAF
jgi:aspartyl-tRNA(Asn)/glutamyl-tRNA(Gln) amidotransferase subunit A